jgi:indolepyruvate ferredoxin oxidoreductase beta subunit
MKYDVYLVGVGGQGVLTIGELLAEAAAQRGIPVSFYPSKGMAQRGGAVKAQLRLGRHESAPRIPEKGADLIIAMELSEALKAVRFVRPGGDFLLFDYVWAPTEVMLGRVGYPTLEQVTEQINMAGAQLRYLDASRLPQLDGASVAANVFVLGAALGHTGIREVLSGAEVAHAIKRRWPSGTKRNLLALQAGMGAVSGDGHPAIKGQVERIG